MSTTAGAVLSVSSTGTPGPDGSASATLTITSAIAPPPVPVIEAPLSAAAVISRLYQEVAPDLAQAQTDLGVLIGDVAAWGSYDQQQVNSAVLGMAQILERVVSGLIASTTALGAVVNLAGEAPT